MKKVEEVQATFESSWGPGFSVREVRLTPAEVMQVLGQFGLKADTALIAKAASSSDGPSLMSVEETATSTVVALMIAPTGAELD